MFFEKYFKFQNREFFNNLKNTFLPAMGPSIFILLMPKVALFKFKMLKFNFIVYPNAFYNLLIEIEFLFTITASTKKSHSLYIITKY